MEPLSGLLVATAASIVAPLIKSLVSHILKFYSAPSQTDITITTDSGQRLKIGEAKNLSEEKIRQIIATLEQQSKTASSEHK